MLILYFVGRFFFHKRDCHPTTRVTLALYRLSYCLMRITFSQMRTDFIAKKVVQTHFMLGFIEKSTGLLPQVGHYSPLCSCPSVQTHISVTTGRNFLIWAMMMDCDVGLMPLVSTFWYCLVFQTHRQKCLFLKKVPML